MYSQGVEDQNYLRGVQVADANGVVRFASIFPACYSGRWPHIHFEVYPDQAGISDVSNAIATSQVALPQDVCEQVYAQTGYEASVGNLSQVSLQSDNVFGDDGGVSQLATVTGDVVDRLHRQARGRRRHQHHAGGWWRRRWPGWGAAGPLTGRPDGSLTG